MYQITRYRRSPRRLTLTGTVEHGVVLDLVDQVEVGVAEKLAAEQAQRTQVAQIVLTVERLAADQSLGVSPGKPEGATTLVSTPPAHGYVVPGAVLDDGKLHMIVDQRPGAQPAGVCSGMPMP